MSASSSCPACGQPLPPAAPQGLCPACLLRAGIPTGTVPPPGAPGVFVPPPPVELAAHFPQLEIVELIGQGGMGAVYRARQPSLDRQVALKILPPHASGDPGFAERFTREARALARLSHPNIVAVHDFGQAGAYHYVLMEFVDGMTLRQLLNAKKIPPREALAIVPPICDALQYAHDQGIVHRDIKPENILLGKNGMVKIADFGLAKLVGTEATGFTLTRDRDVMGTPHYMAPEQVERPLEVDHRADIFSLGVVFYQMLTGELPLGRFAPPSRKVQVDVRLDEIVLRALEKEPEQRYQQATALKTDVETIHAPRHAGGEGATAAAPAPGRAWNRWGHWILLSIAGLCVVVGVVLLVGFCLTFYFRVARVERLIFGLLLAASTLASVHLFRRARNAQRSDTAGRILRHIPTWTGLAAIMVALGFSAYNLPRPAQQQSPRGQLSSFTPAILNHPAIGTYIIVQAWLFEIPETMTLKPEDFAAAQRAQIAGVRGRTIIPATSTLDGRPLSTHVTFAAQKYGNVSVTPRFSGAGFDYTIAVQLDAKPNLRQVVDNASPWSVTRREMTASGEAGAGEPLILEIASFAPGRKHVVVFSFQRWSHDIFTDPTSLQPSVGATPLPVAASQAKPEEATSEIPRPAPTVAPPDFQPSFEREGARITLAPHEPTPPSFPSARRNTPAYTDYDAMESDPEILKIMLQNTVEERRHVQARRAAGVASDDELADVEARLKQLEARLAGDRVAFASAILSHTARQLAGARERRNAGVATDADVQSLESKLRVAEIRLRRATEQAEAKDKEAATASSTQIGTTAPAYPEYDAMDSDPDILRELIQQAMQDYAAIRSRMDAGIASKEELDAAMLRRMRLDARLKGDRLGFASATLLFANEQANTVTSRHRMGLATEADVRRATSARSIAEANMRREGEHAWSQNPPAGDAVRGIKAQLAGDGRARAVILMVGNTGDTAQRVVRPEQGTIEIDGVSYRFASNRLPPILLAPGRSFTRVYALDSELRNDAGETVKLAPGKRTVRFALSVEDSSGRSDLLMTAPLIMEIPPKP